MIREYLLAPVWVLFWAGPLAVAGWFFGYPGMIGWVVFVFAIVIGSVALRRWRVSRVLQGR